MDFKNHANSILEWKNLLPWLRQPYIVGTQTLPSSLGLGMVTVLKKIALGLLLIVAAAAVLLYSDLDSRRVEVPHSIRLVKVAVVQQISIPPLDDGVTGALAALKERGYGNGGSIIFSRFNAQGDIGTANAIAKEVTSGNFDLILSFSTVSLQTIANANRFAAPPRRHVFALVSDPYAVGVGVSRENHSIHPPYMTGVGSLAPVQEAFDLARRMQPTLNRVGLVWDPSEANSVVTTKLARTVCASMGITLVEASAENSTAIGDAVAAVLARGVQAIWISPDLVATHGIDLIVSKARIARVPVFTSIPSSGVSGALFELGANYEAIGRVAGNLAADVLDGRDPAGIPVENVVPVTLKINELALKGLREKWTVPPDVVARANVVVDETGTHMKSSPSTQEADNH
ncbi:MAG TPA: ABC transporter substrate-binding protein [Terracidiphilus sp.]|nr:ABC transporter substrate-binding protein [Terracidiphilus sp.]